LLTRTPLLKRLTTKNNDQHKAYSKASIYVQLTSPIYYSTSLEFTDEIASSSHFLKMPRYIVLALAILVVIGTVANLFYNKNQTRAFFENQATSTSSFQTTAVLSGVTTSISINIGSGEIKSFHKASGGVIGEEEMAASALISDKQEGNPSIISSITNIMASLPPWLRQYIHWHNLMREKFPDREIIDHPDSPPKLIMECTSPCAGLHDRMGLLDRALIFANVTGRVLMWSWHHPYPLEEFLRPTLLNWTVPHHPRFTRENITRELRLYEGYIRRIKRKYTLYDWYHRTPWIKNEKVLTARGLSNPFYTDILAGTNITMEPDPSLYRKMWQSMFAPSVGLQKELDKTFAELNLQPGHYTATHVRVRHPARYARGAEPDGRNGSTADVSGLPWGGDWMETAIKAGVHAVDCSRLLLGSPEEPIYFYSDSEDLVQHMVIGGSSSSLTAGVTSTSNATLVEQLNQLTSSVTPAVTRVVSRDTSNLPAVHIDNAPGDLPVEAFYSTFIDLFMGSMARCVSFGVGNYAYLATKISATTCLQRHEDTNTVWLATTKYNQEGRGVPMCPALVVK
jgi:hypothetical protein